MRLNSTGVFCSPEGSGSAAGGKAGVSPRFVPNESAGHIRSGKGGQVGSSTAPSRTAVPRAPTAGRSTARWPGPGPKPVVSGGRSGCHPRPGVGSLRVPGRTHGRTLEGGWPFSCGASDGLIQLDTQGLHPLRLPGRGDLLWCYSSVVNRTGGARSPRTHCRNSSGGRSSRTAWQGGQVGHGYCAYIRRGPRTPVSCVTHPDR